MIGERNILALAFATSVFVCAVMPARAEEITTNGTGGGRWSDATSWKGGKVPSAADEVVVRKFDVISVAGECSCKKLQVDPKGVVQFQSGGAAALIVGDGIENFGVIKADATRSPRDKFEIRLLGETPDKRQCKLGKGAGLLLYGHKSITEPNVRLVAVVSPGEKDKEPVTGLVDVDGPAAIDWNRIAVVDVKLVAKKIDNTGAKTVERMNLLDCRFSGLARVQCHTCDTPIIARNRFDYDGPAALAEPAINVLYSPLCEIKENAIRGKFAMGISVNFQSDSSILENKIEGCAIGINGGYGIPSTMIKGCAIRGCETGIKLEGANGVIEQTTIDGAASPLKFENSTLQLTHVIAQPPAAADAKVLSLNGGEVSLLNCGLRPEQAVLQAPANNPAQPTAVITWQYVVVGAKAPAGAVAEVRTIDPAPAANAADLNVRFSPAVVVEGKTARPDRGNAIVVKSWSLDAKGPVKPAPGYEVRILGPAAEGVQRPVLKAIPFRPAPEAFRGKLDDDTPTLEVDL